jgi:predicted ATPase/class 3 adenylate cyclase
MTEVQQGRICPTCGFADNSLQARFCGQCASVLLLACPQCGAANPPGFRFCGQCTAPLSDHAAPATTLRVVTVLFADVCNYTALTQRLGAERMYMLLDPCLRRLGETVRRFEGTVDKFTGDGLMAVFGMPIALEQHAVQAAYAALAMFDELAEYNASIAQTDDVQFDIRLGLASGEVVAGRLGSDRFSDLTVIGEVVNLAARLQQIADPHTTAVHHSTAQIIAPLFDLGQPHSLLLKGYEAPVEASALLGKRDDPGQLRGLAGVTVPLVGREKELRLLEESTLLLDGSMGGVIWILGEAGVGKSRLTDELLLRLRGRSLKIYQGECSSATRHVPYSAFLGVVRELCDIHPTDSRALVRSKIKAAADRSRVSSLIDVVPYLEYLLSIDLVDEGLLEGVQHFGPAQLKQQVFLALRELLIAEACQQPVMLVLDDLHWVDEVSIELIAYLADALDKTPFLLYLIARNDQSAPLQSLIDTVLAKADQRGVHLQLERLSEQDLVQMAEVLLPNASATMLEYIAAQAEGVPFYLEELARHALEVGIDLQWQNDDEVQPQSIPPSLVALMRARYDRLPTSLATILAQAAVIGRRFNAELLRQVAADPDLLPKLTQLAERGFIRSYRGSSEEWVFMHMLTQETVYASMLATQRRELHATVGLQIEQNAGERIDEHVDTLAFHFARSPHTDKAIMYTLQAAERAAARYANEDALRMYGEVERLLPTNRRHWRRQRIALQRGKGDVLALTGRYTEACSAYQEALAFLGAPPAGQDAAHILRMVASTYEKQGQYDEAMVHLDQARAALADGPLLDHARIDADAGWINFFRGDLDTAERLLRTALTVAELHQHLSLQALTANRLAGICWQRGDLKGAEKLVAQSLTLSRRLNDQLAVAKALNNLGVISVDQANWVAAEEYYAQSMATYIGLGDINGQIRTALNGTYATIMRGHLDEAFRSSHLTYSLARQINEQTSLVSSRLLQGMISFFAGDYRRARRYLIEGACSCRVLHSNYDKQALIIELLSRVALNQGKQNLAFYLARRAVKLAHMGGDALAVFQSKLALALVSVFRHEFAAAGELLAVLDQDEICTQNKYQGALLKVVHSMAAQHQRQYREALMFQMQAEALFEEISVPKIVQRIV